MLRRDGLLRVRLCQLRDQYDSRSLAASLIHIHFRIMFHRRRRGLPAVRRQAR